MAAVRKSERLAAISDARTLGQPYLPKIFGIASARRPRWLPTWVRPMCGIGLSWKLSTRTLDSWHSECFWG